jgi:hypothetical protein
VTREQRTGIERLRTRLRDGDIEPIVRNTRTMNLDADGGEIVLVCPKVNTDSEHLARATD